MNSNQQSQKQIAIVNAESVLSDECPAYVIDALDDLVESGVSVIAITSTKGKVEEVKQQLLEIGFDFSVEESTFPVGSMDYYKKSRIGQISRAGAAIVSQYDPGNADIYRAAGAAIPEIIETEIYKADTINLNVPAGVRAEARRGLDWRREFGRGGIGPGQVTARMLISNKMTIPRVRKMRAYLARHEVDKKGEGWSPGQKGFPSAGRIAWALWGGDPGKAWSNKVMRSVEAKERKR
jgi:hypothetical protein